MQIRYVVLILLFFVYSAVCYQEQPNVFSTIKAGFQMAGKFLGLDRASNLAQLVSETFAKQSRKKQDNTANIFSGFLRLLGLDTKKLSAIAVNAIIFVAQLISTSLSKTPPSQLTQARKIKNGDPLEWLMSNSKVIGMLGDVKDYKLPDNIVEYIKERGLDEETDCIQLLICKTAPLIWGMQKSLNTTEKLRKDQNPWFAYLPTIDEFRDHADSCEDKHPYCYIYY